MLAKPSTKCCESSAQSCEIPSSHCVAGTLLGSRSAVGKLPGWAFGWKQLLLSSEVLWSECEVSPTVPSWCHGTFKRRVTGGSPWGFMAWPYLLFSLCFRSVCAMWPAASYSCHHVFPAFCYVLCIIVDCISVELETRVSPFSVIGCSCISVCAYMLPFHYSDLKLTNFLKYVKLK